MYELNDRFFGQWAALHIPFRDLEELTNADVERLVPRKYKHLANALKLTDDIARVGHEYFRFFSDFEKFERYMKAAAKPNTFIRDVQHMINGQRKLIDMYLTGVLDKGDEAAAAAVLGETDQRPARDEAGADVVFNKQQLFFEKMVNAAVDRAVLANHSDDWGAADAAREAAYEENKPVIALGKPGTGKTTVVKACIRRALAAGARVLFALPTAQLASRMREAVGKLGDVCVDTCHAAFKLNAPEADALPLMTLYDFVIVDEVSLLDCPDFDRMMKLWSVAEKVPALVFLGDKYQLPGVGDTRAWESAAWRSSTCQFVTLAEPWRCKEPRFQKWLDELRTSKPSKYTLEMICRTRKAWDRGEPTADDLKRLYSEHPGTQIVTCTRLGAHKVNLAAVEATYGRKTPLTVLPGDVDVNPDNYDHGKLRTDRKLKPSEVPVYKGMNVYLTRNIRKEDDFVNGMLCTVESWDASSRMLRVRTRTGHRLAVTPWTDSEKGNVVYYPVRLGYASTIHRVQGDEFEHITIWLDVPHMPAAGYTALSRVSTSDDYLIGGLRGRADCRAPGELVLLTLAGRCAFASARVVGMHSRTGVGSLQTGYVTPEHFTPAM